MSAEKLRQAAGMLRSRVGKLTIDTARWDEAFRTGGVYGDHSTYERLFVHPAIGLALADWLDDAAREVDESVGFDGVPVNPAWPPFRVADLVIGGDA